MKRIQPLFLFVSFLIIVALCVVAQAQLLDHSASGFLWLGAAGVLAFLVIAPLRSRDISGLDTGQLELTHTLRWVGVIVLVIGGFFVMSAAILFHQQLQVTPIPTDAPWIQYVIGLVLTFAGGLVLVGVGRLPRPDITVLLLMGVVAIAVFLRVFQVDQYPFGIWYDEWMYGLHIRNIMSDPTFRPVTVDAITFPHLLAFMSTLEIFGLDNIAAMRLITVLMSSAGVIGAYLVGRELRGKWFGLTMAVILAVLRWSINFSRIALPGPETVTFTLFAMYFALRFVRYGRLRDGFWFGISLGSGFYFYGPYQLQLLAIGVYLLIVYPFLRRRWWRTITLGLTTAITAIVVMLPLLVFVIDQRDAYFGRLNQVSIFNEDLPDNETVSTAILESTLSHLKMFHLLGDGNGRHNLPGEPMLDPVTGSLLVIGLFAGIRERRREHLMFLLSIATGLLAGVLSLSFEAPQSHRAIGAITGVIYFAALGLEGMTRVTIAWLRSLPPLRRDSIAPAFSSVGVLAAVGLMTIWNFHVYFNLQRTNLTVWMEYTTIETLTARFLTNYDSETQFYMSPLIGISLSVQFLAADEIARTNVLVMPDPFPLRIPPSAPAVIMLVPSEDIYVDYLRQIYPNGNFRPVRPVDYGVVADPNFSLMTIIELSPEDISGIEGFNDGNGILYAPMYDNYTFTFPANAQLTIDNQSVESETPIQLAEGNHRIVIDPPDANLSWQYSRVSTPEPIPDYYRFHDPVTPNGVLAEFYDNSDWEGNPVSKRIYPFVNQYIHVIPMNRPYSVRYTGYLYAPETGEYRFGVEALDTGALDIDGNNVIETREPNNRTDATLSLEQGWHTIEVRHQDLTSATHIYLTWLPPGETEFTPIGREYLCPVANLCDAPDTN